MVHNWIAGWLVIGVTLATVAAGAAPAWAAGHEKEEKHILRGPTESTFGLLMVALDEGAVSEVRYQPDANRLAVKTQVGEARVIVAARYLILVENLEGRVTIQLATGRVVVVEPGRSEIVGRALVEDPGQIIVRLASEGVITVLLDTPAAALAGVPPAATIPPPPVNPRPESLSPSSPSFGATE